MPGARGRYDSYAPLGERGWFKCGGQASILFKPADPEDLQNFLRQTAHAEPVDVSSPVCCSLLKRKPMPVHIFGALSNTIIRDGGLPGVTIRLGREFAGIGSS